MSQTVSSGGGKRARQTSLEEHEMAGGAQAAHPFPPQLRRGPSCNAQSWWLAAARARLASSVCASEHRHEQANQDAEHQASVDLQAGGSGRGETTVGMGLAASRQQRQQSSGSRRTVAVGRIANTTTEQTRESKHLAGGVPQHLLQLALAQRVALQHLFRHHIEDLRQLGAERGVSSNWDVAQLRSGCPQQPLLPPR